VESGSSGISVVEIPSRGQVIPVSRESVAAFIGPAPRGPVDIPVAVRSLDEFLRRFGVPGCLSRMEFMLGQFFDSGGTLAVVVRVCRSGHRNLLRLPGPAGELRLAAANPGPLEHLRACVDYEGIAAEDRQRFNLVIHRFRSPAQPLVEEQESWAAVTVDPGGPDYIGDVLTASSLVQLQEPPPAERPTRTLGGNGAQSVRYVYSRSEWQGDNTPTDYDLIGAREAGTGLFALEQVPWLDFICLLSGVPGAPLGPVALFAAERYCRERHALLIIDPPANWTSVADVSRTQHERGFTSPNALTYFPPLRSPPELSDSSLLSAAGAIAGTLCAAGLALPGRLPLSVGRARPPPDLDEMDEFPLSRLGVNAIVHTDQARIELGGMVTLARSGGVARSWNNLRERRIALFILSSLAHYTRWAAFEAASEELWRELRGQVGDFLAALHARGLLAGDDSREAFYVKCDTDTNGCNVTGSMRLVLIIGVALARPGDFIAFRLEQGRRGCDAVELGWQPGLALAG